MQYQILVETIIIVLINATDKTHLIDVSGNLHIRPLYLTIGSVKKNYTTSIKYLARFKLGLSDFPQKVPKILTTNYRTLLDMY